MKDEIKEIKIIKSNHSIVIIKNGVTVKEQFAIDDEILDYITTLEQKAKETEEIRNETGIVAISMSKRHYDNLMEELETLKGSSTSTKQWLYKQNKSRLKANLELVEERDKYKSRNEKAIEVLKNTMYPDIAKAKALNILQGEDKE